MIDFARPAKRTPQAFVYLRYSEHRPNTLEEEDLENPPAVKSTDKRPDKMSPAVQLKVCRDYHARVLKDIVPLCNDRFLDSATSGGDAFLNRKAGAALNARLDRGDHVIINDQSRFGRDLYDTLGIKKLWKTRGIILHFTDWGQVTDDEISEFTFKVVGDAEQLRRRQIGNRLRVTKQVMKEQGRNHNGRAPYGFKWAGNGKNKVLRPCPETRAIGQEIVRLRDQEKLSFEKIAHRINESDFAARGLTYRHSAFQKVYTNNFHLNEKVKVLMHPKKAQKWYLAELGLQSKERANATN